MVRRESKTRQSKPQLDPSSLAWLQGQVIPSGDRFQPESEIDLVAPAFRKDTHFAVLNAPRDKDCIIRRVPMLVRQGDHWIPSLSLRLLMLYHTIQPNEITVDPGRTVRLTSPNVDLRIPVVENPNNGDQELLINYRGVLKNFAALPFQAMMEAAGSSRRDPDLEKILQHAHEGLVIIGVTATGWDVGPTPLHPNSPLVTVHVNAVNNLLQEDFLRTTPEVMVFVLTLLLSSFVAWSTQKLSAGRGAMAFSGTLLLFLVIIWRLFVGSSLWVPFVIPSAGLILAYTGGTALRFTGEERQKRELRRAFGNYLSANIMEEVLKNPAAMQLGGDLKEITVLFTDVRGFTSFCEQNRADPKKVVAVLNEVLGVISEIVIKHDGTLDKYIGDCVMAFWGAPTPGKKHHAQQAVEAAFEMRHVLARCRKEWETRGLPVLYLGVGINTGTMVVGNIGSERRLRNYTVIGHEVNMGARLESQTRQFDTDIILSQATVDHLGPNFKTRYLAEVQVKGAEQPLKIYALEDIQTA
jgi:adenylate cyclase